VVSDHSGAQENSASTPAAGWQVRRSPARTVRPGDTLSEIGAQLGVSWRELARINHLDNPDLIFPGQVLRY
jgi:nucleoid-associated protein YgaU